MTLLEVLLALALLSALTVASVSWSTSAARASAVHGSRASWQSGAAQVFEQIDRMLIAEDHSLLRNGRDRWRVATENGDLLIRTRTVVAADDAVKVGTATRFALRDRVLTIESLDETDAVMSTRPLLGELSSFSATSEQLESHDYLMTVRCVHESGRTLEHSWLLAREDVR